MSVTIRQAEPADVDAMQRIEIDAGRRFADVGLTSIAEDEPMAGDVLLDRIAAGRAWLAVDGERGEAVGFAVASVVDGAGHLDEVAVALDAGGQGIGTALIEQVLQWAAGLGLEAVTLTTFSEIAWNGPLYRRLGFEALDPGSLGPQLLAIRDQERRQGIDVAPRQAMRRRLPPPRSGP
jgi:ribosomal protein S18 acetylase RimI-like enzyme